MNLSILKILYLAIMILVIVGSDILFFRNHFLSKKNA